MAGTFDAVVEGLIITTNLRTKQEKGDYFADGLLYCGKCNTPKQCRLNILGREQVVGCTCKCEEGKLEKERLARETEKRKEKLADLRRYALSDARLWDCTFANDLSGNSKIMQVAKRYVDKFDEMREGNKGLLIWGNTGTGKSYATYAIVNALIEKGVRCMVTSMSEISQKMQSNYGGRLDIMSDCVECELLVIDDLGAERDTEYMNEIVYTVINERYKSGKPMIVTTNLTIEEIKAPKSIYMQRISSRLLEMLIPVEVKGADIRRKKTITDYGKYKDMLEI